MVKVWGYDPVNGPFRPGRPYSIQTRVKDSNNRITKRLVMILPSVHDIQRTILARQIIRLSDPHVRQGYKKWPRDFQKRLETFRKHGLGLRGSGTYGGMVSKKIRKIRDTSETAVEKGKWTLENISFRNCITEEHKTPLKTTNKRRTKRQRIDEETLKQEKIATFERRRWKNKMVKDIRSERVNEILANIRMVVDNGKAIDGQPLYTICLEAAVHSLKVHDWAGLAKSLCGMIDLFRTKSNLRANSMVPSALNAFWMLGFLAIINNFKGDVVKLANFAKCVRLLLGGHPLWLGSHLSAWLIQKGYALSAFHIIEKEYEPEKGPYLYMARGTNENPKRDLCVLFSAVIPAVHRYCLWKKENSVLNESDANSDGDRLNIRRIGEGALDSFEVCFVKCKEVEGDFMCFIEPFVELLVEFRSPAKAKEVMDEVFNLCDGNFYVETYYVQFLEEYFANSEDDMALIDFLKKRTERKFILDGEKEVNKMKAMKANGRRVLNEWRNKKKTDRENVISTMKPVKKPSFSW